MTERSRVIRDRGLVGDRTDARSWPPKHDRVVAHSDERLLPDLPRILRLATPSGARGATTMNAPSATLRTRIEVPRLPAHAVERPRLMERLAGHDWRVCVMAAGPGTGKTTFAAQWVAGLDGAWLSLHTDVDQCERFWSYAAAALQRARPGAFDATEQLAIRSGADSAAFVTQLLEDASALRHPLVLVLEDLHVLREPAVIASLTSVVEGLPPHLRLLVTSRSDPALPLARWRARSWLVDIRQRDLQFDRDEVKDLLAALGEHRLTGDEVIDLQVRTEGWAAALVLTALSMRDGDADAVARGVTRSNRLDRRSSRRGDHRSTTR